MDPLDSAKYILLIEDDIVDIKYIKYGFIEHKIQNTLIIAESGVDALDKIYGRNNVTKIHKNPAAIILDINLPKMNGFVFLEKLRTNPQFAETPVFILSSSNAKIDRVTARNLNVAGYFLKPLNFEDFLSLYKNL